MSIITIALVGTIVSRIGNIRFSYFIAGIPFLTVPYSSIIGEEINMLKIFSGVLVALGIILANVKKRRTYV